VCVRWQERGAVGRHHAVAVLDRRAILEEHPTRDSRVGRRVSTPIVVGRDGAEGERGSFIPSAHPRHLKDISLRHGRGEHSLLVILEKLGVVSNGGRIIESAVGLVAAEYHW
jgi:hypothetical protein